MTDKPTIQQEVDSYFSERHKILTEIGDRHIAGQPDDYDRHLKLPGLNIAVNSEELEATLVFGVSSLIDFEMEMAARGEKWITFLGRFPEDIQKEILDPDNDLTFSGAYHNRSTVTYTHEETGDQFTVQLTQIIYQHDDPELEAFYIGHEEGHILHETDNLAIIYKLWTEETCDLINTDCLNPLEDHMLDFLGRADKMDSLHENPAITEAVAHLGGLYAAFLRYDPQQAVPAISPGTDTEEFRHVIWLLQYRGEYCVGSDKTRKCRAATYNWGNMAAELHQPNYSEVVEDADPGQQGSG